MQFVKFPIYWHGYNGKYKTHKKPTFESVDFLEIQDDRTSYICSVKNNVTHLRVVVLSVKSTLHYIQMYIVFKYYLQLV